jgi:P4 family phage/plasmid primase-like protien
MRRSEPSCLTLSEPYNTARASASSHPSRSIPDVFQCESFLRSLSRGGKDKPPMSHSSFCGSHDPYTMSGLWYVPPDQEDRFAQCLAILYQAKIKTYAIEARSGRSVCTFIEDYDLYGTADFDLSQSLPTQEEAGHVPITAHCLLHLRAQLIQQEFMLTQPLRCAIFCSSGFCKTKHVLKTSLHVVWMNVFVTSDTSLRSRQRALEYFADEHPSFADEFQSLDEERNTLDSIMDVTVLKGNGVRMPYSDKYIWHDPDDKTRGGGPANRPCLPLGIWQLQRSEELQSNKENEFSTGAKGCPFTWQQIVKPNEESVEDWLFVGRLRCAPDTTPTPLAPDCLQGVQLRDKVKTKKRKHVHLAVPATGFVTSADAGADSAVAAVESTIEIEGNARLRQFIEEAYKVKVSRVVSQGSGSSAVGTVGTAGTAGSFYDLKKSDSSRNCPFARRTHLSNTLYFVERSGQIYLKCRDADCWNGSREVTALFHEWLQQHHTLPSPGAPIVHAQSMVCHGDVPLEHSHPIVGLGDDLKTTIRFLERGGIGLADLFVHLCGTDVKVTDQRNFKAYCWDERSALWQDRTEADVARMMADVLEHHIVARLPHLEQKQTPAVFAAAKGALKDIQKTTSGKSLLYSAKPALFDRDESFRNGLNMTPDLLPTARGTVVNLRTCTSMPRTKLHLFSFEQSVQLETRREEKYVDSDVHTPAPTYSVSPNFEHAIRFFSSICEDNLDLLNYLQMVLGYCLTAETSGRCLFVWYGPDGRGGKGTVTELMEIFLGNLFVVCEKEVWVQSTNRSAGAASPQLACLKGARMASFSETKQDDHLNEGLLKAMTSNTDYIAYRPLFQEQQKMKPVCKLVLQTNHKPNMTGHDQAMRDRVKCIPFKARFVNDPRPDHPHERKRDDALVAKIKTDYLNEVFTWIVQGAQRFYAESLDHPPQCVRDETNQYADDNDPFSQFLKEACDVNPQRSESGARLNEQFQHWCSMNGARALTHTQFGQRLKAQFTLKKSQGIHMYQGIGIVDLRESSDSTFGLEPKTKGATGVPFVLSTVCTSTSTTHVQRTSTGVVDVRGETPSFIAPVVPLPLMPSSAADSEPLSPLHALPPRPPLVRHGYFTLGTAK